MKLFIWLALTAGISFSALALKVKETTIERLGTNLSSPVFMSDFLAVKSNIKNHIIIIDTLDYTNKQTVSLLFEAHITMVDMGRAQFNIIELEDKISLIQDKNSLKLAVIASGNWQKSPRLVPPPLALGELNLVFSQQEDSLFIEAFDKDYLCSSGKVLLRQKMPDKNNVIDYIDYKCARGAIKAVDCHTGAITMIISGHTPSLVTKIDDSFLANANWGSGTVSIIDKLSLAVIKTIAVGNYPLRPVVHNNKIYVSNFGDGSISVLTLEY